VIRISVIGSLLAAVAATPLQGAPLDRSPSSPRAPRVIRGLDTHWSPSTVQIAKRGVVRWRGVSSLHDVVSYAGDWSYSRALPEGSSVKRRFPRRGTFRFRCTLHSSLVAGSCSGMCGSVIVAS
jgi:plastocyanin